MTDVKTGFRSVFGSVHVVIAATILLVSAVTVNVALDYFRIVLAKAKVPLNMVLDEFPETIGDRFELARMLNSGESLRQGKAVLTSDVIKTLGTEDFITWYFKDKKKSTDKELAYIRVHMAYYTQLLDAAPHVPGNCQLAAGALADSANSKDLDWTIDDPPAGWEQWSTFGVRQDGFAWQSKEGADQTQTVVFYLFIANGEPKLRRLQVITLLSPPWKKYCYYMKIEMTAGRMNGKVSVDEAEEMCRAFLAAAAPEIFKHVASGADIQALEASR